MISRLTVQVPDSEAGKSYPQASIRWEPDPGGLGYRGRVRYVRHVDGSTCAHELYVGMTGPVCHLYLALDAIGYGCVSNAAVPLADLTVRDLIWAAWWGFSEIRRYHMGCGYDRCEDRWREQNAAAAREEDAPK